MDPEIIPAPLGRARQLIRGTFFSLKHRNFRLYFFGQIVSNTGNWLTNVALTLLVLKLTHSGLAVGLLAACQFGPILLLSAWGGAIADRVDKRKFLMLTQTLEMAESIGLAVLAFLPHTPLVGLFLLAAAGGTFLAFDNPLRRSFVSEMVPDEDVPNAVVLYSTIVNLSRVFGPALAGLLIVTVGYGWCFTADAASYLAVLASLIMMRASELYKSPLAARAKGQIRAGLAYARSEPALFISLVMLLIIGTLAYNFGVTLPLFVTKSLHKSDTTYTILYSVMSIGSVLTALVVARRRLVDLKYTIIGAVALGLSMFALALTRDVPLAIVASLFVGAASILYSTTTTTLVQIRSKPSMRGRVLALQTVLLIGTTPLGGPLLGWLADASGGRTPLVLGGFASLAAAGFGYWASRIHRRAS